MPAIVSKLLHATIWSRCSVLFESEQTPSDLLLCTGFYSEHAALFLCLVSTQRPMTDRKIERSYGCSFGQHQLVADSMENFVSHEKKKWLVAVWNLQSIKTLFKLLTLELSQYRKSDSIFSSREPVTASSDCSRLRSCVCACPSDAHTQSRRAPQRAWLLILPSKPLIAFWNSLQRDFQTLMTCRGSNLDSNLNSAAWVSSLTNEL